MKHYANSRVFPNNRIKFTTTYTRATAILPSILGLSAHVHFKPGNGAWSNTAQTKKQQALGHQTDWAVKMLQETQREFYAGEGSWPKRDLWKTSLTISRLFPNPSLQSDHLFTSIYLINIFDTASPLPVAIRTTHVHVAWRGYSNTSFYLITAFHSYWLQNNTNVIKNFGKSRTTHQNRG